MGGQGARNLNSNIQINGFHNTATILENNTHKLLWDFDIHTDHLISARRPNNNQQKKEKL